MSNVVNLNNFRKRKAKAQEGKPAETNRGLHGQTRTERTREELKKRQRDDIVDGARLTEPKDDPNDDV